MACLQSSSQESYLCLGHSSSFPSRRHWRHPFVALCSPSSVHSLPEYLLCFMLAPGTRTLGRAISHHRTLKWGVIALGHRGHIEEVSTETQQGNRSGVWGGVGAALIHQIAVPAAGQDCRTGPLPKLPRWLPPSWDPLHRSFCQPGHGGHWLLLCFPRHPLTSDVDVLLFLGPCLQGLHHGCR